MRRVIAREWLVFIATLVVSLSVLPPLLVWKSTRVDRPSIGVEAGTNRVSYTKELDFLCSPEGKAAKVEKSKLAPANGYRSFAVIEAEFYVDERYHNKWEKRTAPEYLRRSRIMAWKAFYLSLVGGGMYGQDCARAWLVILLPYGLVQFARSIRWAVRQVKR